MDRDLLPRPKEAPYGPLQRPVSGPATPAGDPNVVEGRFPTFMSTSLDVDSSASHADPEAIAKIGGGKQIEGRSLGQIAWMRLKRDRVALLGFYVVAFFMLVAIFAPLLAKLEGTTPTQFYGNTINQDLAGMPLGHLGGISSAHWFGVEPPFGRDIFARIVYGARVSLAVSIISTILTVIIGTIVGTAAGYFGGWIDQVLSRLMDVLLAFPQLLFILAMTPVIEQKLVALHLPANTITREIVIVSIISFFGWPYIGRIIRGQSLSLREREFIDAARSLGAGSGHIVFKQLLPNLVAPILVYGTLIIPTYVALEASLSFLGQGVIPPTPSWGDTLNSAVSWYQSDPTYLFIPGLALLILVLAFNLFGDGLRDALDPKAGR